MWICNCDNPIYIDIHTGIQTCFNCKASKKIDGYHCIARRPEEEENDISDKINRCSRCDNLPISDIEKHGEILVYILHCQPCLHNFKGKKSKFFIESASASVMRPSDEFYEAFRKQRLPGKAQFNCSKYEKINPTQKSE